MVDILKYKECPICGKVFVSNRKYCSDSCSKIGKNKTRKAHSKHPIEGLSRAGNTETEYRKFRATIRRRAHGLCELCGAKGNCTHHIKHVSDYPELELVESNALYLCTLCHSLQHPELPSKFILRGTFNKLL